MSENEYPKAVYDGALGWSVEWDDRHTSAMPDEATARRCAASGKMLEALQTVRDKTCSEWLDKLVRPAISSATGGE